MIKVYATVEVKNNLITTIPFKGLQVRVEFAGGNSMKNIPAKFYTRDPFTMKALDSSDQLGQLYYVHQILKEEGDDKPARKATVRQTENPASPQFPEPPGQQPEEPAEQGEGLLPEEPGGKDLPEEPADAGDGKLEFADLGEVITWIATHYGEQVETENAASKLIEEREGVKPIIHRG